MLFTESFITDGGKAIFARAAAQEGKIIWTRAATSSLDTDDYTTAEMNALTEATFGTKTSLGFVTNAVVNDPQDTVTVYSEVTNEHYSGEARTFGAWAKIEGDVDDVLVLVARCGDGVTPTTVNPSSSGVVKAFVDFAFEITTEQAQSVEVSEGWYASQAALQTEIAAREALAARVVTTHKKDSTSQGDDQTIRGAKTFKETIKSETGSAPIVSKTFDAFQTSYGGCLGNYFEHDGDSYEFYTSSLEFNSQGEYHWLVLKPEETIDGLTRSFGIVSQKDNGVYSQVMTYIDKHFVEVQTESATYTDERDAGRIMINVAEPKDHKKARIELNTGYDSSGTGFSNAKVNAEKVEMRGTNEVKSFSPTQALIISPDSRLIGASNINDPFSNPPLSQVYAGYDSVNGAATVAFQVKNSFNQLYDVAFAETDSQTGKASIYPVNGNVGLGTNSNPYTDVYAGTLHGDLSGNATSATNDLNGYAITRYIEGLVYFDASEQQDPTSAPVGFDTLKGNNSSPFFDLRPLVKNILLGRDGPSSQSAINDVGRIALCVYVGAFPVGGFIKYPGDLVKGADLKYGGLRHDSGTGDINISAGSDTLDGTWRLLSMLAMMNAGDFPLCLAIKVSNSTW